MSDFDIKESEGAVVFTVKVIPASSRTAIAGFMEDMLKVKVSAAPEKGRANKCLIDFFTRKFGVKKKTIEIISGRTSPVKQVRIQGVTAEDVMTILNSD